MLVFPVATGTSLASRNSALQVYKMTIHEVQNDNLESPSIENGTN